MQKKKWMIMFAATLLLAACKQRDDIGTTVSTVTQAAQESELTKAPEIQQQPQEEQTEPGKQPEAERTEVDNSVKEPESTNQTNEITVDNAKNTQVILGNYKGIVLTKVTKQDIEDKIAEILEGFTMEDFAEHPAELGNTVNINYIGYMDGEAFAGGTDDSEEGTDLLLGSGTFIPGFEEGLLGTTAGDEVDINLSFPDPYYNNPSLSGKPVTFHVTVNYVLEPLVPEFNDYFVQDISECKTVEEYRQMLEEELNEVSFSEQLQRFLLEECEVINPPTERLEEEKNAFVDYYMYYAQIYASMYGMEEDVILQLVFGISSREQLEEIGMIYAEENVYLDLCLREIAVRENFVITEEAYEERVRNYAIEYEYEDVEEFIEVYGEDTIKEQIARDMVFEFLMEHAVIVDAE